MNDLFPPFSSGDGRYKGGFRSGSPFHFCVPGPRYVAGNGWRKAFTLIELMVVLGIGLLVLAVVIPYAMSLRESANRTICTDNLRQIMQGLTYYVRANDAYPMTPQNPERLAGFTAFTGIDDDDPFAPNSAVKKNDVTASLWLLVRGGYLTDTRVFICPSTSDYADNLSGGNAPSLPAPRRRGNFRSARNLSYGMASPFSAAAYYAWNDTLPAECVLLADQGPGSSASTVSATAGMRDMSKANSPNHGRAGQNVLYADSSVRFETQPFCGIGYKPWAVPQSPEARGDNIYTALRAKPILPPETPAPYGSGVTGLNVGPAWIHDTYLVPAATDDVPFTR